MSSYLSARNANGDLVLLRANGLGTLEDPLVLEHDSNLKVAGAHVALSNPVPVIFPSDQLNALTPPSSVIANVATRTPTTTSVTSSPSSGLIVGANNTRKGLSFWNSSTSILYLSFTSPATSENAFMYIAPQGQVFLDQQLIVGNAIYGVWASANGSCKVTEYV